MAPGVQSVNELVYVSPVQPSKDSFNNPPFEQRSGYLFFGFNNLANKAGLIWFINEVLPLLTEGSTEKLHVAGTVAVPSVCRCENPGSKTLKCRSTHPFVECHGPLSDDHLNKLIKFVKVAINPVREPSGVATKTCRAMALGTPVVVTTKDGTFNMDRLPVYNPRCIIEGDIDNKTIALIFANSVKSLSQDADAWNKAAIEAPTFIAANFGVDVYSRNWVSLMQRVARAPFDIVIIGEADCMTNVDALDCINWLLIRAIHNISSFPLRITVVGESLSPPIPAVRHLPSRVETTSQKPNKIFLSTEFGIAFETKFLLSNSAKGFNLIPQYCGPSCRALTWRVTESRVLEVYRSGDKKSLMKMNLSSFVHPTNRQTHQFQIKELTQALELVLREELGSTSSVTVKEYYIPYELKTCYIGKVGARLMLRALTEHFISVAPFTLLLLGSILYSLRRGARRSRSNRREE